MKTIILTEKQAALISRALIRMSYLKKFNDIEAGMLEEWGDHLAFLEVDQQVDITECTGGA